MSESQLIEYKESWRDECLKWICASFACQNSFSKTRSGLRRFANAQGGVLYIGKRDDGSVCGVADSKKLMEDIPNKVRDALGLIVDVDLITENGLDVIKITVEENPYPVNYKGEYHYRTGSTKQLLQGSVLTNFLLRKTGKNWDSVPLENVSVEDLDKESFDIFHREAIRSGRMSKDDLKLSNQDLLEKLNLLDGTMLKRAAVFNALIHQDFSVCVPVQISVYKDKLYISNDCIFPAKWTADTLMQKHRSLPYNPDIANTFFRSGFIESWGRGIEKICRLCKEYGIAEPEYTVHPNDIMMMFKANGTVNDTVKTILALIEQNPSLTYEEMIEKTGKSRRTISRLITELKEKILFQELALIKLDTGRLISMDIKKYMMFYEKKLNIIERIKSDKGKEAVRIAERLMDIYSFHHKFQTKEFIDRCNQVWSD